MNFAIETYENVINFLNDQKYKIRYEICWKIKNNNDGSDVSWSSWSDYDEKNSCGSDDSTPEYDFDAFSSEYDLDPNWKLPYKFINVTDINSNNNAIYYYELPVIITSCASKHCTGDLIGALGCGGLYTGIGIFRDEINITNKELSKVGSMSTEVPLGYTLIHE